MRAFILYITILTFQLNSVSGQNRIVLDGPKHIDTARMPLIIVDTFRTDINHVILDPGNIQSINIFKDSLVASKFGDAGKYGIIMIYPKPNTTFLRVDKILTEYKLCEEDKKLRICINKTLMSSPQLILIDKSEIERVEITTDRYWTNTEDANSGERFINIVTRTKDKSGL
jgi:hypothetical protein